MKTKMVFTGFLVALALSLTLGTKGVPAAAEPQYGGTYRTAMSEPRSLDPHMETYAQTTAVTNNTNNRLIRWNKDMSGFELDLVESWQQINPLTYEFKLRKGIKFHNIPPVNGRELTSEDVKYSIERVSGMHGQKASFKHKYYFEGKLTAIETPDKYTVIFKLNEPFAPFLNYIASDWSVVAPKEAVDSYGDLKRNAVGSGPFILAEYVKGSHITMVKNAHYFKEGLPYLDEISIKIMTDPSTILAAFLAGNLDAFSPYFFHVPVVKEKAPDAKIERQKSFHMWVLRTQPCTTDYGSLEAPFNDRRVRQALGLALDKEMLLKLALGRRRNSSNRCCSQFSSLLIA